MDKPFERLDELREPETGLETLNKELAEDADKPQQTAESKEDRPVSTDDFSL